MNQAAVWRDMPVFLTGHTGFKGSWLSLWLHMLGAKVYGYALDPDAEPNLYDLARVKECVSADTRADLADLDALKAALSAARPKLVLHLAAQALVRAGYDDPIGTFATNVMGTAHLLEAVRGVDSVEAVVVVTTDKVYDNRETGQAYRETDPLGGHDPYSASKGAAEIVAASYRGSFFDCDDGQVGHPARVATARAGNVIGGGDWAVDRLVPDCVRAFASKQPVSLRYPDAVRPWQHVLEPLSGYLKLAQALLGQGGEKFAAAWNFGPDAGGDATVGDVAQEVAKLWGSGAAVVMPQGERHPHEAGLLRLDIGHARTQLGWQPRWSLPQNLQRTVAWYKSWSEGGDVRALCEADIRAYGAPA